MSFLSIQSLILLTRCFAWLIMVEVVRNNFEDVFPEIKEAIEESAFVAIDAEFTGLYTTDGSQPSLFDDPETRYKKLKRTASQFLISQYGLTAFVPSKEDSNKYVAHAYNIFLYPHSFGPTDCRFLCQASSLEFLCQHNFDFNKFIYNGVPYLNDDQATVLQKYHTNGNLYSSFQSTASGIKDEDSLDSCCVRLEEWLLSAEDGDTMDLILGSYQAQYLFIEEVKRRYTDVKCHVKNHFKVLVKKLATATEDDQESNTGHLVQEQERIISAMIGFSRVVQVLASCKKPLVGHNVLTDLMMTYERFYKPLPESLQDFKSEVHKLFPLIYDTKFLAFEIRKNPAVSERNFLDDTNLEKLHAALSSNDAQYFALYTPSIPLSEKCYRYLEEKMPHEAGYDSFLSGFVFLRMAHILAYKSSRSPTGPLPFSKFLRVLKPFENLVHLSRATVQHVNLIGPEPPSIRPQWLYITSKITKRPLVARTLAQEFAGFGSVDLKILDSQHALVALAQHRRAKDVLSKFRCHKTLSVRPYNAWLDSPEIKIALWYGGTALFVSGVAVFLWKSFR